MLFLQDPCTKYTVPDSKSLLEKACSGHIISLTSIPGQIISLTSFVSVTIFNEASEMMYWDIGSVNHFADFWIQKSHHFNDFWIQKSLHFYDFWIQKYNLSIFWCLESEKWYVSNYIWFCSCWFLVFDNKWHLNKTKTWSPRNCKRNKLGLSCAKLRLRFAKLRLSYAS